MMTLASTANGTKPRICSPNPTVAAQRLAPVADTTTKSTHAPGVVGTGSPAPGPPEAIRRERVEEVADEAEEIARTEAREEVADQVADRRAPRGRRAEQERAHDRQRVGGTEVGDAGMIGTTMNGISTAA
jgi:hypothetical protein